MTTIGTEKKTEIYAYKINKQMHENNIYEPAHEIMVLIT